MSFNVGSAIAYLDLDTTRFTTGLQSALQNLLSFSDASLSLSSRIGSLGTAMTTAGLAMAKGLTVPIVGLGVAATKVAADFEAGMSKVEAISGATAGELERLTDKALEMGAKTKFSAKESADAFTYMAMAGWKTEDMLNSISGIMSLAAADGLDLATTSDIVTDAMTAFGLAADGTTKILKDGAVKEVANASYFADVLAQASSSANTNVSMLGESFKYVAPVAGALGMNVEDVALALGLMANSGIKGSQAGTALRASLVNLVKPTDKMLVKMEELGIEATKSDGSMKSLREIMDLLRSSFSNLTEAEQANAAATLFGKEAMSGMLAIITASEGDYNNLADAIANSNGRADEMATTMMDNLPGSIEQLLGAFETLLITLGTALIPTIREVTDFLTKLIETINSMDEAQINTVVQIGAIVAAIGPLLMIGGKILTLFSSLSTILPLVGKLLVGLTGPVGIAIAVITGLIALFTNLYNTNEEFREKINEIWEEIVESIEEAIESIKEWFEDLKESMAPTIELLQESFNSMKEAMGESLIRVIESAKVAFEKWQPILEVMAEVLGTVITVAISTIVGAINGLLNALAPLTDVIAGIIELIGNLGALVVAVFQGDFELAKEILGEIWENIKQIFASAFEAIIEFVVGFAEGFWETLKGLFASVGVDLQQFVDDTIESIKEWVANMIEKAVELGTNFLETIVEFFSNLPYNIGYWIGYTLETVNQWGFNMIAKAIEVGAEFLENIVSFFIELPGKIWDFLLDTFEKIKEWKDDMITKAKETGEEFLRNLAKFFTNLPENMKKWMDDMIKKITEAGPKLKAKGKELFNNLFDGLKSVWADIKSWFEGVAKDIGDFLSGIIAGASAARDAASTATAVDGSHANGLAYVPYDGYIAELHKGERVLTEEENKNYGRSNNDGGDTFIFNSPEPIDRYQAARLFKQTKRELASDF